MNRMSYAPLLAALLLPGCVVAPAPDYVVAPALPVIVELDVVPYHHGGFFYYYHHDDHRWSYSRDKAGPWRDLPRDRYPREIRYRDHDRGDGDRGQGRGRDDRGYRR
ncbi:MAG: hypothetical protein ROZ09_13315 [Thiobacillus sp.]|uniref:hypothetical protein n=1 Tax=Thiobacillus sp. TaxID=924 RepID=UPI0028954B59|nr:hypothetical protein [Thiobacillus sp.]MDT3707796.1 hypothetical protein [Thiobacillus sp.]